MKRPISVLLALCALLLASCAKQQDTPPVTEPVTPPEPPREIIAPAEPVIEPTPPPPEPGVTVYVFDGLEIPVPTDQLSLLTVDTDLEAWSAHWTPLISFSHKASVDAYAIDHPDAASEDASGVGWLGTVIRLDRIGFEEWASGENSGSSLFATDGAGCYYLLMRPTDVSVYREDDAWPTLNEWAEALPEEIVSRNGLTPYDASDLFDADYTYGGEHVELGYRIPGEPMDLVLLALSQPVKQGEGGVWCVERVRYVYSDYGMTDTHLVLPAALGVDQTAADYYADLQASCDAGENDDLLSPLGAAVRYARSAAWLFGEDVSASDFEAVEALG